MHKATVGALAVVLTAGCSSSQEATPQTNPPLANTSWSGTCAGLETGTYSFEFGPLTGDAGMVKVMTPNAPQGVQTVRYTTPTGPGTDQQLVLELNPRWHGAFTRDLTNLQWNPLIGETGAPAQCFLKQAPPQAGG